ncbi:hypothetical protein ACIBL6_04745 [Streptomyces sp. NPDC050400]|uniref:hypothetical protein n=1 Tax=Streptomyces sp. NPDC050400 TaxID=3365610 RepID=UPI0037AD70F0
MVTRRRIRRLVVDGTEYGWSFGHRHNRVLGYPGCASKVTLWRPGSRARLRLVFRPGEGRIIADDYFDRGATVRMPGQVYLNLYEPGTVRALLDEALARGLFPTTERTVEVDAWPLFDAVAPPAPPPAR